MNCTTVAIIVGTGLWKDLSSLPLNNKTTHLNTPVNLGDQVVPILYHEIGFFENLRVVILPRHGNVIDRPQRAPAELILSSAHEAHIWFLSQLGVDAVYAFNTVGALDDKLPLSNTNTFLVPDQMAYGFGAPVHSFKSRAKHPHPEMNQVMSASLRNRLREAIRASGGHAIDRGTYIYSNPDHLETQAEGKALKRLFADANAPVVGSTAGAECTLCKEMHIPYAMLCSMANYVQGTSDHLVNHEEIRNIMDIAGKTLVRVVNHLLRIHTLQNKSNLCTL